MNQSKGSKTHTELKKKTATGAFITLSEGRYDLKNELFLLVFLEMSTNMNQNGDAIYLLMKSKILFKFSLV